MCFLDICWRANVMFRKENMAAFLKVMNETFGGAETYMVEKCGLTKEEVATIRKSLIVEKAS